MLITIFTVWEETSQQSSPGSKLETPYRIRNGYCVNIWALGLPGVVISLAMRKTAGFDFRRVHHAIQSGLGVLDKKPDPARWEKRRLVFENAGPLSSLRPKTKTQVMLPEVKCPKCVYA